MFNTGSTTELDEDDDDPNTYDESARQKFQRDWGLYDMLVKIADGDLIKVQGLYDLPIISIFNHLSYVMASGGWKK